MMSGAFTAPLGHPNFRSLVAGRTFARFGNAVAPVALAFAVLDLTGSAVDLGVVVGARSLANVLLVLFGGMLADRLPRAIILQGTELAAAATQATIAASVLCGFSSIPLLVALSVVNGAVSAISLPAAAALTPQTVPSALLVQANAVARIGDNLGRFTGAALGGVLVAGIGTGWAIAANALLFLLASVCFRGVRLARVPRTGTGPLRELTEGWQEFRSRTWVWVVVLQFMVVNAVLAGGLNVLGPVVADATIGRTAWGFALAADTAGSILGGYLAARRQPRRALLAGVAVILFDAVPLLVLGSVPAVFSLLVTMFLTGVATAQFGIAWDLALQENVPPEKLARVYSYDMLGSFVALPAGEIAAGPLAASIGPDATLFGGTALIVLTTLGALLSREVRTLERKTLATGGK
jgi:MFS family permease